MKHFQFSREDYKYILTWSEAYGGLTYGLSEVVLLGLRKKRFKKLTSSFNTSVCLVNLLFLSQ